LAPPKLTKPKQIGYGESSRKFRRTVYTHDDWARHRSPDRFLRNLVSITSSGKSTKGSYTSVVFWRAFWRLSVVCLWGQSIRVKPGGCDRVPLNTLDFSRVLWKFSLIFSCGLLLLAFFPNRAFRCVQKHCERSVRCGRPYSVDYVVQWSRYRVSRFRGCVS
jgi:hypothetical protein